MSLIHQALKKIHAAEKTEALNSPAFGAPSLIKEGAGGSYFNLPAARVRTILLALSSLILVFAVWWAMVFKKPQPDLESMGQANLRQIQSVASFPDVKGSGVIAAAEPALSVGREDGFQTALKAAKIRNINGVELYKHGSFFLAKNEFLSSIEIFPEYAEAYNNLGLTYKQLGDMKGAEVNYKKALQYKPGYPEAMNNYGILLETKGNSNAAREYFKKAVLIAPDYPDPYLNMAVSLENGKRIEDAIIYYEGFLSHAEQALRQAQDEILLRDVRERVLYLKANSFAVGKNRQ
ncbi:MAG: tetratricopeptide repeat protein [Deltaproteobacteria bacterium]